MRGTHQGQQSARTASTGRTHDCKRHLHHAHHDLLRGGGHPHMSRQQGRFEAGRILLPKEVPWLADFENEVLVFPGGRYDDQVDALLLFLEWFAQNERYPQPITFCPPIIVRRGASRRWDVPAYDRSMRS